MKQLLARVSFFAAYKIDYFGATMTSFYLDSKAKFGFTKAILQAGYQAGVVSFPNARWANDKNEDGVVIANWPERKYANSVSSGIGFDFPIIPEEIAELKRLKVETVP